MQSQSGSATSHDETRRRSQSASRLPVRAGADESQRQEVVMNPWNEFVIYMSVVVVWMLVVYGIAKLKGE